jgi:hypothetical protein
LCGLVRFSFPPHAVPDNEPDSGERHNHGHRNDWRPSIRRRADDVGFQHFMMKSELTLTNPEEDDGRHDEHVHQRRHHAAEDRRRERFHDFRTDLRAPHDREQACHNGGYGHHFRAQPQ